MTSQFKYSVLVFGNSSISNSLCHKLCDDFIVYYLPSLSSSELSKPLFMDLFCSRSWLSKCLVIKDLLLLQRLLVSEKISYIFASCSLTSIHALSNYISIHSILPIFFLLSFDRNLSKLSSSLNSNIVPCFPNIATEFHDSTIKTIGSYLIELPSEFKSCVDTELIFLFNSISSFFHFEFKNMEFLFRAKFLVTSLYYIDILEKSTGFNNQFSCLSLASCWDYYSEFINSLPGYEDISFNAIDSDVNLLLSLNPDSFDVAWILGVLLNSKIYKIYRFLQVVHNELYCK